MSKPTAILFDLDDTLIDRRTSITAYSQQFHADFAAQLQPVNQSFLTEQIIALDHGGYSPRTEMAAKLANILPWRAEPDVSVLHKHWMEHFPNHTQARAHAAELLQHLKGLGVILGLVTNGSTIGQNRKVDKLGFRPFFSTIIISETVGIKKPAPDIFHQALNEIQRAPHETWFVGDNPRNDILGAAEVGMTPIWLRGMHDWPESAPSPRLQIDSLIEIRSLFEAC